MAWIILWANGEELQRLELRKPVIIGRAADCEISVRDVLMSRNHCRIEPLGHGWRVVDLGSKNGTRAGWQRVASHVLRDGDWLRMGRTRLTFYATEFQPAAHPRKMASDRMVRPADPHEALTGTVTDFVLLDDEAPANNDGDLPTPQPRPLTPASYHEPAVETLLDELASSFWSREGQSATTLAAPPAAAMRTGVRVRALPRILPKTIRREIPQHQNDTDLSLQADAALLPPCLVAVPKPRSRRWIKKLAMAVVATAATGILLLSAWLLTLAA